MNVLFFGITRDIVGTSELLISDLVNKPTVNDLKEYLKTRYSEFSKLTSFAVAVNNEYAKDNVPLERNDEIAIIPPVSGG
ncbi:molybdopterin synthase sulfur carrier subunit [Maribacter vaceletii]|uniref:Molybdopterin synthase sulfur carrier subunit n=1 Tax=Maribacter vaceletii TaxID=1206816 RepID=A0A495DVH8_9FLAO|nr:molybdopterin converting factor subunit 1 [Maribacter vaceletii]RKR07101.1 molybdopterin synthase sulfur carrier subunit [Maribacter vaceletii]